MYSRPHVLVRTARQSAHTRAAAAQSHRIWLHSRSASAGSTAAPPPAAAAGLFDLDLGGMLGFSGFVMTANDGCALLAVLRPATAGRRRGQGVRGMGGWIIMESGGGQMRGGGFVAGGNGVEVGERGEGGRRSCSLGLAAVHRHVHNRFPVCIHHFSSRGAGERYKAVQAVQGPSGSKHVSN